MVDREIKFRAWNKVNCQMLEALSMRTLLTEAILSHKDLDELVIMQYTGLKDANGAEIYEGDVVNIDGLAKLIKFEELKDKSYGHGECYFTRVFGFSFSSRSSREPVVIGNIYQNPELLNG